MNSLDLLGQNWSAGDFSRAHFRVTAGTAGSGPVILPGVAPTGSQAMETTSKVWGAAQALARWTGVSKVLKATTGSQSIHELVPAIDQLARQALNDQLTAASPGTVEEKLQKLDVLLRNLVQHDRAIAHFNATRLTTLTTSRDHKAMEVEVMKRRHELLGGEGAEGPVTDTELVAWRSADQYLAQLSEALDHGMNVDRAFVTNALSEFENRLTGLQPGEQQRFRARHHQLLNQAYKDNFTQGVESGKLPTPQTLLEMLSALGVAGNEFETQQEVVKAKLLERIGSLSLDYTVPTGEFIKKLREEAMKVIAETIRPEGKSLSVAAQKNFMKIAAAAHDVELQLWPKIQQIGQAARESVIESHLDKLGLAGLDRADMRQRLSTVTITDPFLAQLKVTLLEFSKKSLNKSFAQALENRQDSLYLSGIPEVMMEMFDSNLQAAADQYRALWEDAVENADFQPVTAWLQANSHHCLFEFSQSDWGSDEILGGGVCQLVDYRWKRIMMADPDKRIRSSNDLRGLESYTTDSGISRADRVRFAEYTLSLRLGNTRQAAAYEIPPRILKRDGLKEIQLAGGPAGPATITELLDQVMRSKADGLSASSGIMGISAFGKPGEYGHALGCRVDQARGIYSFWDVNGGMWEYASLDEMKAMFDSYLKAVYRDGFAGYSAYRFEPS